MKSNPMETPILTEAANYITKAKITSWTKDCHLTFLMAIITALSTNPAKLRQALDVYGLGGNASQFQQKLKQLHADSDSAWHGKFPLVDEKKEFTAYTATLLSDDVKPEDSAP